MNTKTTLWAIALLLAAQAAPAKDVPIDASWSGIWSDLSGQHRCAIVAAGKDSRLTVLCQLGRDGVYADLAPAPPSGWQIFVDQAQAPFGQPPAGAAEWGQITWFAVCDTQGPALYSAVYRAPDTMTVTLRPVALSSDRSPCAPMIGGAR